MFTFIFLFGVSGAAFDSPLFDLSAKPFWAVERKGKLFKFELRPYLCSQSPRADKQGFCFFTRGENLTFWVTSRSEPFPCVSFWGVLEGETLMVGKKVPRADWGWLVGAKFSVII